MKTVIHTKVRVNELSRIHTQMHMHTHTYIHIYVFIYLRGREGAWKGWRKDREQVSEVM